LLASYLIEVVGWASAWKDCILDEADGAALSAVDQEEVAAGPDRRPPARSRCAVPPVGDTVTDRRDEGLKRRNPPECGEWYSNRYSNAVRTTPYRAERRWTAERPDLHEQDNCEPR
jgi:hypothetical protein